MTPEERQQCIQNRLTAELAPTQLEITDDSHQHVGHPGAQSGASHFTVCIKSPKFEGLSLVARHRLIYDILGDLIPHEIHALKIQATP